LTKRFILGVDPGLFGAFALVEREGDVPVVAVYDMPLDRVTTATGKRRSQIDLTAATGWIDLHADDIALAVVEEPGAMPGQGVASTFRFGFACGAAQALVAAHFLPYRLVAPAAWKRAMRLVATGKDGARQMATRLLPRQAHLWPRVKDDGRAEAVLLALYGRQLL